MMSFLLLGAVFMAATPKPNSGDYFLVYGSMENLHWADGSMLDAANTWCVVSTPEDEIYVAFKANEDGEYEFNLPVGQVYTMTFGGKDYVNKKVEIDARKLEASKKGLTLKLDMLLFTAPEDADVSAFEQPVAKFMYEESYRKLVPDMEYIEDNMRDFEKAMRKIEKESLRADSGK